MDYIEISEEENEIPGTPSDEETNIREERANIKKLLHKCITVNCLEEVQFLRKPFRKTKMRIRELKDVNKLIHKCMMANCFKEMLIVRELKKPPSEETKLLALNQICMKLHKRLMEICFEEMLLCQDFKKCKKPFLVEWLNTIHLNDIEPYKIDPPLKLENPQ